MFPCSLFILWGNPWQMELTSNLDLRFLYQFSLADRCKIEMENTYLFISCFDFIFNNNNTYISINIQSVSKKRVTLVQGPNRELFLRANGIITLRFIIWNQQEHYHKTNSIVIIKLFPIVARLQSVLLELCGEKSLDEYFSLLLYSDWSVCLQKFTFLAGPCLYRGL